MPSNTDMNDWLSFPEPTRDSLRNVIFSNCAIKLNNLLIFVELCVKQTLIYSISVENKWKLSTLIAQFISQARRLKLFIISFRINLFLSCNTLDRPTMIMEHCHNHRAMSRFGSEYQNINIENVSKIVVLNIFTNIFFQQTTYIQKIFKPWTESFISKTLMDFCFYQLNLTSSAASFCWKRRHLMFGINPQRERVKRSSDDSSVFAI